MLSPSSEDSYKLDDLTDRHITDTWGFPASTDPFADDVTFSEHPTDWHEDVGANIWSDVTPVNAPTFLKPPPNSPSADLWLSPEPLRASPTVGFLSDPWATTEQQEHRSLSPFGDDFVDVWAEPQQLDIDQFTFHNPDNDDTFKTISVHADEDDLWCHVNEPDTGHGFPNDPRIGSKEILERKLADCFTTPRRQRRALKPTFNSSVESIPEEIQEERSPDATQRRPQTLALQTSNSYDLLTSPIPRLEVTDCSLWDSPTNSLPFVPSATQSISPSVQTSSSESSPVRNRGALGRSPTNEPDHYPADRDQTIVDYYPEDTQDFTDTVNELLDNAKDDVDPEAVPGVRVQLSESISDTKIHTVADPFRTNFIDESEDLALDREENPFEVDFDRADNNPFASKNPFSFDFTGDNTSPDAQLRLFRSHSDSLIDEVFAPNPVNPFSTNPFLSSDAETLQSSTNPFADFTANSGDVTENSAFDVVTFVDVTANDNEITATHLDVDKNCVSFVPEASERLPCPQNSQEVLALAENPSYIDNWTPIDYLRVGGVEISNKKTELPSSTNSKAKPVTNAIDAVQKVKNTEVSNAESTDTLKTKVNKDSKSDTSPRFGRNFFKLTKAKPSVSSKRSTSPIIPDHANVTISGDSVLRAEKLVDEQLNVTKSQQKTKKSPKSEPVKTSAVDTKKSQTLPKASVERSRSRSPRRLDISAPILQSPIVLQHSTVHSDCVVDDTLDVNDDLDDFSYVLRVRSVTTSPASSSPSKIEQAVKYLTVKSTKTVIEPEEARVDELRSVVDVTKLPSPKPPHKPGRLRILNQRKKTHISKKSIEVLEGKGSEVVTKEVATGEPESQGLSTHWNSPDEVLTAGKGSKWKTVAAHVNSGEFSDNPWEFLCRRLNTLKEIDVLEPTDFVSPFSFTSTPKTFSTFHPKPLPQKRVVKRHSFNKVPNTNPFIMATSVLRSDSLDSISSYDNKTDHNTDSAIEHGCSSGSDPVMFEAEFLPQSHSQHAQWSNHVADKSSENCETSPGVTLLSYKLSDNEADEADTEVKSPKPKAIHMGITRRFSDDIDRAMKIAAEIDIPQYSHYKSPQQEERDAVIKSQRVKYKRSDSWIADDIILDQATKDAVKGIDSKRRTRPQKTSVSKITLPAAASAGAGLSSPRNGNESASSASSGYVSIDQTMESVTSSPSIVKPYQHPFFAVAHDKPIVLGTCDVAADQCGISKDDLDSVKRHWEERVSNEPRENLFPKQAVKAPRPTTIIDYDFINQNVESESTDMAVRRQQWETMMQQNNSPIRTPKSPYSATIPDFPSQKTPNRNDKVDGTQNGGHEISAIELEIRMAEEREAALRRQRGKLKSSQSSPGKLPSATPAVVTRVETNVTRVEPTVARVETSVQRDITYNEMTEADRGSQLNMQQNIILQDIMELKRREEEVKRDKQRARQMISPSKSPKVPSPSRSARPSNRGNRIISTDPTPSSSVRPIDEVAVQDNGVQRENKQPSRRSTAITPSKTTPTSAMKPETTPPAKPITPPDVTSQIPPRYPDIQSFEQRQGGNIVTRDMLEYQNRLKELEEQRKLLGQVSEHSVEQVPDVDTSTITENQHRDFGSIRTSQSMDFSRRMSSDSTSRSSSYRSIGENGSRAVSMDNMMDNKTPRAEVFTMDETEKFTYTPKSESIIERERRLVREREVAHRRAQGLEAVNEPKSVDLDVRPRGRKQISVEMTDSAMRNYASGQLRNEIKQQRKREMDLKKEGKIRTTSEDHIDVPGSVGYITHVKRQNSVDGLVDARDDVMVQDSAPVAHAKPSKGTKDATKPKVGAAKQKVGATKQKVGATKPASSADVVDAPVKMRPKKEDVEPVLDPERRKSRNPQETRIEAEMREMKRREEELKKQRQSWGGDGVSRTTGIYKI